MAHDGTHAAKRSPFTEEQIAFAPKQQELDTSVEDICGKREISDVTLCNPEVSAMCGTEVQCRGGIAKYLGVELDEALSLSEQVEV